MPRPTKTPQDQPKREAGLGLMRAMTCVAICDGGPKTYVRTMRRCPFCQRLRPIAGFYQEWYGTTWTCLGCGDSWSGGEMLPRPFARGWRQKAIASGRRMWAMAS